MITYTVVAGDLGDVFYLDNGEPFRYVKISFIGAFTGERPHEVTYKIPVHAFGGEECSFYTFANDSKIICRGWLEEREGLGVVMISEIEELFPKVKGRSNEHEKRVIN